MELHLHYLPDKFRYNLTGDNIADKGVSDRLKLLSNNDGGIWSGTNHILPERKSIR